MPSYLQLESRPIQIRTVNGFSRSWQRRYAASCRAAPRRAEPSLAGTLRTRGKNLIICETIASEL